MAKNKKRAHRGEPAASVVLLEGDEFPTAITVELWQRRSKGKRTLVGSRQYEAASDQADPVVPVETAAVEAPATPAPKAKARARTKAPSSA